MKRLDMLRTLHGRRRGATKSARRSHRRGRIFWGCAAFGVFLLLANWQVWPDKWETSSLAKAWLVLVEDYPGSLSYDHLPAVVALWSGLYLIPAVALAWLGFSITCPGRQVSPPPGDGAPRAQ